MNHNRHCKRSHGAAAETKRQQPSRKETTMQEYKDWDGNLLPDPVRAPGCTRVWIDARILYHRMVKEDAMKNKNVWFAYAAAWISTATAVIFAIKYTGSAWCLVALMLPAMQKISISNDEENGR